MAELRPTMPTHERLNLGRPFHCKGSAITEFLIIAPIRLYFVSLQDEQKRLAIFGDVQRIALQGAACGRGGGTVSQSMLSVLPCSCLIMT